MKLKPVMQDGAYVFASINEKMVPYDAPICIFREADSTTVIIPESVAIKLNIEYSFRAAWIVLTAETSLNDLGITAKFAKILSDNGISCNVFAPIRHDHIFVPYDKGEQAVKLLEEIEI
ncbi:MAG: ACT domain-containing protein [Proteobacteria bacterium]|nr:ACT domain-containing protein [Pseudomonadota bacterium]